MNVSSQSWILVGDDLAVGSLVEAARATGEQVTVVVAGPRAVADSVARAGVDRVLWLGGSDDVPAEAFAGEVARIVADAAPRAVLATTSPSGRALIGAVAARLQVPVLAGIGSVEVSGDQVVVSRTVFGGIVEHRTRVEGAPALLALAPGAVAAAGAAAVEVETVEATPLAGVRVTAVRTKDVEQVDLGSARTVVAVGRGLKARDDVALLESLAAAFGGELGCSRPLAEGVDWIAKERYIGISGQHISPELYVAVGISGQLQHMVGVRGAGIVVAVNSDKAAPVFAQCDFGIVGDLYQVVPALTAALQAEK